MGGAKNAIVDSAPSAGCVPQPVWKKFQPVSPLRNIWIEVGQSTTWISALMPTAFICSACTTAALYMEV